VNILGIETSCDETSISIVQNGTKVLTLLTQSSMESFTHTGGVIPEQAARKQMEFIPEMIHQILKGDVSFDAIAVTTEPGLQSSLLVGKTTASILRSLYAVPLIPVHHTQGHICSIWLEQSTPIVYPALCVSLSGGHTELWLRTSPTEGVLLGQTQDDAIGEAFDKGATLLGLEYPGGPAIAREAVNGNPQAYQFPIPLHGKSGYNFSYSGLKTALRTAIQTHDELTTAERSDLCASYQHALCVHIVTQLKKAAQEYDVEQIHIVGGVAANIYLRERIQQVLPSKQVIWPSTIAYCTDNAAMIASAGYFALQATY
jgi:N6-L-threonylcarbamoyladenine synthase